MAPHVKVSRPQTSTSEMKHLPTSKSTKKVAGSTKTKMNPSRTETTTETLNYRSKSKIARKPVRSKNIRSPNKSSAILSPYLAPPYPLHNSSNRHQPQPPPPPPPPPPALLPQPKAQEPSFDFDNVEKQTLTSKFPMISNPPIPSSKLRPSIPTPPTSIAHYQLRKQLMNNNIKMVHELSMLPKNKSLAQSESEAWQAILNNKNLLKNMIGPNWKVNPKVGKQNNTSKKSKILIDFDSHQDLNAEDETVTTADPKVLIINGELNTEAEEKVPKSKTVPVPAPVPVRPTSPTSTSVSFPSTSDLSLRSFLHNRMLSNTNPNTNLHIKDSLANDPDGSECKSKSKSKSAKSKAVVATTTTNNNNTERTNANKSVPVGMTAEEHINEKNDITRFQKPLQEIQQWVEQQNRCRIKMATLKEKRRSHKKNNKDPEEEPGTSKIPVTLKSKPVNTTNYYSSEDELKDIILKTIHSLEESIAQSQKTEVVHPSIKPKNRLKKVAKGAKKENLAPDILNVKLSESVCTNNEANNGISSSSINSREPLPRDSLTSPLGLGLSNNTSASINLDPHNSSESIQSIKKYIEDFTPPKRLRLSQLAANKLVETSLKSILKNNNSNIKLNPNPSSSGKLEQLEVLDVDDTIKIHKNNSHSSQSQSTTDTQTTSAPTTETGLGISITVSDADTTTDCNNIDLLHGDSRSQADVLFKYRAKNPYWSTENLLNWAMTSSHGPDGQADSGKEDQDHYSGTGTSSETSDISETVNGSQCGRKYENISNNNSNNNNNNVSISANTIAIPMSIPNSLDNVKLKKQRGRERKNVRVSESEDLLMAQIREFNSDSGSGSSTSTSAAVGFDTDTEANNAKSMLTWLESRSDLDHQSRILRILQKEASVISDISSTTTSILVSNTSSTVSPVEPKIETEGTRARVRVPLEHVGVHDINLNLKDGAGGAGAGTGTTPKLNLESKDTDIANSVLLAFGSEKTGFLSPQSFHILKDHADIMNHDEIKGQAVTGTSSVPVPVPVPAPVPVPVQSQGELYEEDFLRFDEPQPISQSKLISKGTLLPPNNISCKKESLLDWKANVRNLKENNIRNEDVALVDVNLKEKENHHHRSPADNINPELQQHNQQIQQSRCKTLVIENEEMEFISLTPLNEITQGLTSPPRPRPKAINYDSKSIINKTKGDQDNNRDQNQQQLSASANWTESVRPRKRRQKCQRRVSFSDPVALYKMLPGLDHTATPADSMLDLQSEVEKLLRDKKLVFRYPTAQKAPRHHDHNSQNQNESRNQSHNAVT